MKKRLLFVLCLILGAGPHVFAQTKTVTNADLEKFRQKRLAAEKEYRENYAQMGFPSPEELDRQIEQERLENEELAARLREERLQKEGDFQARAYVLRSQIVSLEGQLNYLRAQLPVFQPIIPRGVAVVVQPGGFVGGLPNVRLGGRPIAVSPNPRAAGAVVARPPVQPGNFPGQTFPGPRFRGGLKVVIGDRFSKHPHHGFGKFIGHGFGFFPPIIYDNRDYTLEEIVGEIRLLEQQLAGVRAQWRLLEEDARRAGVKIR